MKFEDAMEYLDTEGERLDDGYNGSKSIVTLHKKTSSGRIAKLTVTVEVLETAETVRREAAAAQPQPPMPPPGPGQQR